LTGGTIAGATEATDISMINFVDSIPNLGKLKILKTPFENPNLRRSSGAWIGGD
jgi:hypothetical protein